MSSRTVGLWSTVVTTVPSEPTTGSRLGNPDVPVDWVPGHGHATTECPTLWTNPQSDSGSTFSKGGGGSGRSAVQPRRRSCRSESKIQETHPQSIQDPLTGLFHTSVEDLRVHPPSSRPPRRQCGHVLEDRTGPARPPVQQGRPRDETPGSRHTGQPWRRVPRGGDPSLSESPRALQRRRRSRD